MDDGKEPIWLRMTIGAVFCFAESPWLTWEQLWCMPSYRLSMRSRSVLPKAFTHQEAASV